MTFLSVGLHQNAGGAWANQDLVTGATFSSAGALATLDFNAWREREGKVGAKEQREQRGAKGAKGTA